MRNEPATKISFGEAKDGQVLIGVGVRKQHFVKVYGVGLYVDLPAAKESMSPFKGKKAKAQGIDFYEALASATFGKILVVTMHYGITKERMASGMADAIRLRLQPGGETALEHMRDLLLRGCSEHAKDGRAGAGTTFSFKIRNSCFDVTVNGNSVGAIQNDALCTAMLLCFLDPKTVSPTLRSSAAEGLLQLL